MDTEHQPTDTAHHPARQDEGKFSPPSLTEIRRIIDTVRSLDIAVTDYSTVLELIRPLLRGFVAKAPVFDPGQALFRARVLDSAPTHLKAIWHPPADHCTIGRANIAKRPLLYCASAPHQLPFEMKVTVGARLVIAQYLTTLPMCANTVGYTASTFEALRARRNLPDYMTMGVVRYDGGAHLINDFLAELFCQNVPVEKSWQYKVSAAVAELMLGASEEPINALLYPTVPMWGGKRSGHPEGGG